MPDHHTVTKVRWRRRLLQRDHDMRDVLLERLTRTVVDGGGDSLRVRLRYTRRHGVAISKAHCHVPVQNTNAATRHAAIRR